MLQRSMLCFTPLFHLQRKEIVTGNYEPNDEECDWPSDSEDEDEEDGEEKKAKIEPAVVEEDNSKGSLPVYDMYDWHRIFVED